MPILALFEAQSIKSPAVLGSSKLGLPDTKVEMKVVSLSAQHSANLATSKAVFASSVVVTSTYVA